MTEITSEIDETWHESLQILLVLRIRHLNKSELCKQVAKNQKQMLTDYERSKSTCIYWIKSQLRYGKIREYDSLLELTQLGAWIVKSNMGSMEYRDRFLNNYTCLRCSSSFTVLYEPKLDTAVTNKKGNVFMDFKCPRCGYSLMRYSDKEFTSAEKFIHFYHKAKDEMRRFGILN